MVERGDYFCINRGRQYGKTTTLSALRDYLMDEYIVLFETLLYNKFIAEEESNNTEKLDGKTIVEAIV